MKGCRRGLLTFVWIDKRTGVGRIEWLLPLSKKNLAERRHLYVIKKMSPSSCPCCGLLFINDVKSLLISRENYEKYIVLISILK